jgi:glucose-6-phosphate isomerase
MPLTLDFNNMLSDRLAGGRGIAPDRVKELAARFREVHADTARRRQTGELGFFELPYASELVEEIDRFANGVGQAFENVVVLGIGGSALGTIALRTALLDPYWNELDGEGVSSSPGSTWWTTRTRPPSPRCSTAWTCGGPSSTWSPSPAGPPRR